MAMTHKKPKPRVRYAVAEEWVYVDGVFVGVVSHQSDEWVWWDFRRHRGSERRRRLARAKLLAAVKKARTK